MINKAWLKSLVIGLLTIYFPDVIFSQPLLDSADVTPNVGDQYIVRTADSFTDSIIGGMNQVWDFSTSIVPLDTDTITCHQIDANLVTIGGVGKLTDIQLEHSKTSIIEYLGLFSDRVLLEAYYSGPHVIGTTKQKFYEFPIYYGHAYQSQFKFEPTGEPWYQEGISYCNVDGFGDLYLPNGIIYTDVYKIKMIKDGQMVYTFTYPYGIVEEVDTMHVWVKAGIGHPLLIIHSNNWVHDISSSKVEYLSEYSLLSTESTVRNDIIIDLYPNPSDGIVSLNISGKPNVDITLFSAIGEMVETYTIQNGETTIDLRHVQPGIYFVKFVIDEKHYSRKIVIK